VISLFFATSASPVQHTTYIPQGLATEHTQAAVNVRPLYEGRWTGARISLQVVLRAEQNRFILSVASTKADDSTATAKLKQLMGEYGPTISSAISPGHKRKIQGL